MKVYVNDNLEYEGKGAFETYLVLMGWHRTAHLNPKLQNGSISIQSKFSDDYDNKSYILVSDGIAPILLPYRSAIEKAVDIVRNGGHFELKELGGDIVWNM